jgi:hypothetical protein
MSIKTTEEAMVVLRETRRKLIDRARVVAVDLANANRGKVNVRAVRRVMEDEGLLSNPEIKDYWLGAVFSKKGKFEWQGEYAKPDASFWQDKGKNFHDARPIKVWVLKGYDLKRTPADLLESALEAWGVTVESVVDDEFDIKCQLVYKGQILETTWSPAVAMDLAAFHGNEVLTELVAGLLSSVVKEIGAQAVPTVCS